MRHTKPSETWSQGKGDNFWWVRCTPSWSLWGGHRNASPEIFHWRNSIEEPVKDQNVVALQVVIVLFENHQEHKFLGFLGKPKSSHSKCPNSEIKIR